MAVVLAGGSKCENVSLSTGIDRRSDSHLLLVGDPGTGECSGLILNHSYYYISIKKKRVLMYELQYSIFF